MSSKLYTLEGFLSVWINKKNSVAVTGYKHIKITVS